MKFNFNNIKKIFGDFKRPVAERPASDVAALEASLKGDGLEQKSKVGTGAVGPKGYSDKMNGNIGSGTASPKGARDKSSTSGNIGTGTAVFTSVLDVVCRYCDSKDFVKRGIRKTNHGETQLYLCKACGRTFTPHSITGKHFERHIILDALSYYNLGFSLEDVTRILKKKDGVEVAASSIALWVKEYASLCPYMRMRKYGMKMYSPYDVMETKTHAHRQLYKYRFHRAKARLIIEEEYKHRNFISVVEFLDNITSETPHQLFQEGPRMSEAPIKFSKTQMIVRGKENYATKLTDFVLQGVKERKKRHESLQKFLIANDSVTIATEVPVYIRREDLEHMRSKLNFELYVKRTEEESEEIKEIYEERERPVAERPASDVAALEASLKGDGLEEKSNVGTGAASPNGTRDKSSTSGNLGTGTLGTGTDKDDKAFWIKYKRAETEDLPKLMTGHVDFLQIRNGMVHILDYKGEGADKVKPIEQLTIYAMALSRLTGLRLYHFKCAWFDEKTYYEFYPLHVVYKKKQGRRKNIKTKEGIYRLNEKIGAIKDMKPTA